MLYTAIKPDISNDLPHQRPQPQSGRYIAEATRRPVTLTQRNKPRLVLMAIEEYRRLIERADAREAHTLDSLPDDVFEDFKRGVELYAAEKENS